MIEFKTVPYEDKENIDMVYFLNPAGKIKTEIINKCSNNFLDFEAITELVGHLKTLNAEELINHKTALLINGKRFECY